MLLSIPYLEGLGDLVSGLIMGIPMVIIWHIGVINLLLKAPDHPSATRIPGFELAGSCLSKHRVQGSRFRVKEQADCMIY